MKLHPGLYEQLITRSLASALDDPTLAPEVQDLPEKTSADLLARHVQEAVLRLLAATPSDGRVAHQVALTNRILDALRGLDTGREPAIRADDDATHQLLWSLLRREQLGLGRGVRTRPGIPLRHSDLIVNGPRDLRVGLEIRRELPSADRVDLLVSFIKWNGFVELRDALAPLAGRIRVLTTTYMGATEVEAVEGLRELGADVRVSYDHRRTRLHAKAWLFHRDSGFSTALVGSSNLSTAALRDGCEWNVRLSQQDNAALLDKFRATFDQYWDDPGFEPFDAARFSEAVSPRRDAGRDALAALVRLRALPHQQAVLDALSAERAAGHTRNLVVAATGTGKTVIAALDYARQPGRPRLLFVAHRDEILEQSRAVFRAALHDGHFGEKHTGREKPLVGAHVFASIQSLHEDRLNALDPAAFDVVIVDEFHHAGAPTYEALLRHLRPGLLLGLTATPERTDDRSILGWFGGRVAAESRLWDALDQELLAPFQYFAVHDGTDLSQIAFRGGRYDPDQLERLYTADEHRAKQVLRELVHRVRDPRAMRAIGFCVSVTHAAYMASYFARHGLPADVVLGDTPAAERASRVRRLEAGDLCALFTVDVFNEGVDIPRVDTVLFLRPTESATVFIQQLGRGLRLHPDKSCLTVLDFVGNARREFRFDQRFRAMLGGGTRAELARAVDEDFPRLPSGCAIHLDAVSRRVVLDNLRRTVSRWAALADDLTEDMDLPTFLRRADVQLEELYRANRTFTDLRAARGFVDRPAGPISPIARAVHRILHVDDADRLGAWRRWLDQDAPPPADLDDPHQRMLFVALGQDDRDLRQLPAFLDELWADAELRAELRDLAGALDARRRRLTQRLPGLPLHAHARYTRAEVLAALHLTGQDGAVKTSREGVMKVDAHRLDLLFVTLDKDERHFTPTTRYQDYPITPTRFHWESQSGTRSDSPTGQRYQAPPEGWRILLFVRQRNKDERGATEAFLCLGPVRYLSHERERPMRITWELEIPAPADWFQQVKIAAG
jgi:superfamily II DNA or RNA helicase/HKD family nuclease